MPCVIRRKYVRAQILDISCKWAFLGVKTNISLAKFHLMPFLKPCARYERITEMSIRWYHTVHQRDSINVITRNSFERIVFEGWLPYENHLHRVEFIFVRWNLAVPFTCNFYLRIIHCHRTRDSNYDFVRKDAFSEITLFGQIMLREIVRFFSKSKGCISKLLKHASISFLSMTGHSKVFTVAMPCNEPSTSLVAVHASLHPEIHARNVFSGA